MRATICALLHFFYHHPIILSLLAVATVVCLYYRHWNHLRYLTRNIPGPPENPLFGNAELFLDALSFSDVNNYIYRAFDRYGPIFKLWMAHELWVCVADSKLAKQVTEFWRSYDAIPSYNYFQYVKQNVYIRRNFYGKQEIYDVTILPELDEEVVAKANEKMVIKLKSKLSKGVVSYQDVAAVIRETLNHVFQETLWKVRVREDYRSKKILNLQDRWDLFMIEVKRRGGEKFLQLFKSYIDNPYLIDGIKTMVKCMVQVTLYMVRFIPNNSFVEHAQEVIQAELHIINTMLKYIPSKKPQMPVFDMNAEPEVKVLDKLPKLAVKQLKLQFTEERLNHLNNPVTEMVMQQINECVEKMTAFTLNLLVEIASHDSAAEHIREEMRDVISKNGGKVPSLSQERKLFYSEMVIKEGLRHYSPPAVFKRAGCDISQGDKTIPNDAVVVISAKHLHMNHHHYEEPAAFHPEHFSHEQEKERQLGTFFPLPLYPGVSSERRFGLKILKLLLSSLVHNFSLETTTTPSEETRDYFRLRKNLDDLDLRLKSL